jgi:hypothetical protein
MVLAPRRAYFSGCRIALLGLSAIILGGCSQTEAPVDRVPLIEKMRVVAAEVSVLRAKMDTEVAACMRSDGFPFFAKTARQHFESLEGFLSIGLGLSVEDAQARGYGPDARSTTSEAELRYFEGLSKAEQEAYTLAHMGTEDDMVDHTSLSGSQSSFAVDGCIGAAAKRVYGSIEAYVESMGLFDDFQFMRLEVLLRAEKDDSFRDALSDWSTCMTHAGYSFEAPTDARDAALETGKNISEAEHGPPTPKEISIASADARCRDKASLGRIFLQSAQREQQSIIAAKERLFLAWDELMSLVAAQGYTSVETDSKDLISADTSGGR